MKKLVFKLAFFASIIVLASSCKKELNQVPTDAIPEENAFTNITDLEQGLLGVYSLNNPLNKIYIGSILADEVRLSNENRGQGQGQFKWQYSSTGGEHTAAFYQYYQLLDRLHRVLAAVDRVTAKTPAETTRKNAVVAQLRALRGIAYYELMIHFMPSGYDPNALAVPIILTSDVFATPGRSTVGEVSALIETELAAARASADLPDGPNNVIYVSKSAVAGYQARLALLKREWAKAVTFSTDALNLSGRSLVPRSSFASYWQDADETETIWKYRNQSTPTLLWRDANGDVFFEPSNKLKNQFNRTTDIRFGTYFAVSTTAADTALVKKYPGSALGPQINDLKIMRAAEMYLIRAEANSELDNLTDASLDLNAVRGARISGYTPTTIGSKEAGVAAVLNERFKELCFEGFRFFDLKRRSLPIERLASDVQSLNWQTLPSGHFRFALPIPFSEMLANPNQVQNTGY